MVAPQVEMPAEAVRPCQLHVLPPSPSAADLEIAYVQRGVQILNCDAARRLAVETHAAEHELEAELRSRRR